MRNGVIMGFKWLVPKETSIQNTVAVKSIPHVCVCVCSLGWKKIYVAVTDKIFCVLLLETVACW